MNAIRHCVEGIDGGLLPAQHLDPALTDVKLVLRFACTCNLGWKVLVLRSVQDFDLTCYEGIALALVLSTSNNDATTSIQEAQETVQILCNTLREKLLCRSDGRSFELLLTAIDTLQILGQHRYLFRPLVIRLLIDLLSSLTAPSMVRWTLQYCLTRVKSWTESDDTLLESFAEAVSQVAEKSTCHECVSLGSQVLGALGYRLEDSSNVGASASAFENITLHLRGQKCTLMEAAARMMDVFSEQRTVVDPQLACYVSVYRWAYPSTVEPLLRLLFLRHSLSFELYTEVCLT